SVSSAAGIPGNGFVGTSAAAAHVAAIAALTEEKLAVFGGCNQPGCVTFWLAFQRYGVINIMGSDPTAAENIADGPGWNRNAGWGIPMADLTVCYIVNGPFGCPPVIHSHPV